MFREIPRDSVFVAVVNLSENKQLKNYKYETLPLDSASINVALY